MGEPTRSKYASTLSPEQVDEIRAAPLPTRHAGLARLCGVTATTIARIRRGLTWNNDYVEVRVKVPSEAVPGLEQHAKGAGVTPTALLALEAQQIALKSRR
ncbi:MAG: hypothetical protein IT348_10380 [Candidatus Eisenbacteria bacterium]|nr:hypothetical protein [Candidatus Eisenbacteria bacterium]